jgi:hypothetical protein
MAARQLVEFFVIGKTCALHDTLEAATFWPNQMRISHPKNDFAQKSRIQ